LDPRAPKVYASGSYTAAVTGIEGGGAEGRRRTGSILLEAGSTLRRESLLAKPSTST